MTTRDFLALDQNGNPQPHAQIDAGVGGRYEADEHGIIADVKVNHSANLLNAGAVPLLPVGFVDPRPVAVK